MSTKRTRDSKKLPQRFLQQKIYKFLKAKETKSYSPKLIAQKLNVKNSKESINSALKILFQKGKITSDNKGRFKINVHHIDENPNYKRKFVTGQLDVISSGAAFVTVKGEARDIYVPQRDLNGALHKDSVELATIYYQGSRRPEGKVVRILKRNRISFIGLFQERKNYGQVIVSDGKIDLEVKVLPDNYNSAEDGQTVIVKIFDFGEKSRNKVLGKILNVINENDRNDFEMNSILISNGFDIQFSPEIISESNALSPEIKPQDLNERRDLRHKAIFTIDPIDAKDFDDALSYEVLENDTVEIGVHIADVTHFVKAGTPLDKEAYKRSTSVYLVDRVCPMLPERISNELCSLRPNEDKFCFSAIFTFNKDFGLLNQWFGKTIIHSQRRFTYEEAQAILDSEEGDFAMELLSLNKIAKHLKQERFKLGSIDFESDEVRFVLDENNKPIGIKRKTRGDSHKLVEEFMLLANKKVAKFISKKEKAEIPYVYRIHDLPDPERLLEFALLASELGIQMNVDTPKNIALSLNKLKESSVDSNLVNILRPMAIRSMAKAIYSTNNIGHYGLGFEYYSHFTSPIRRYSDVLSHRILFQNLTGIRRENKDNLEEKCLYISNQERNAVTAERESIKFKQVEYLAEKIGEEQEGIIRGIIDKGMFVELIESQADGMIRFDQFDESFTMHPTRIKVVGNRSGVTYRIGDRVTIKILDVDVEKKQIEFGLADKISVDSDM